MKAAIDYKKANSELTGVDTFESVNNDSLNILFETPGFKFSIS